MHFILCVCVCVCVFTFLKKEHLLRRYFNPFQTELASGRIKNQKKKKMRRCASTATRCVRACQTRVRRPQRHTHAFLSLRAIHFFFFNNYKKIYFSFLYIPFSFWVFLIFFWGGFVAKGFVNVRFGQFNLLFCLGFSLLLNYFSRVCFKRVCLGNSISLFV